MNKNSRFWRVLGVIFLILLVFLGGKYWLDRFAKNDEISIEVPKVVKIPAGKYMMGSDYAFKLACTDGRAPDSIQLNENEHDGWCRTHGPSQWFQDEIPRHLVNIEDDFYLSQTEVTVTQFRNFVDKTGYKTTAETSGASLGYTGDAALIETYENIDGLNWRNPWPKYGNLDGKIKGDYPVVHVSVHDAVAYTEWLSAETGKNWRLPTETEWEYAATGGLKNMPSVGFYSWGELEPVNEPVANIADDKFSQKFRSWKYPIAEGYNDGFALASPVKTYDPNGFGLFDMSGNVWEWTGEKYAADSHRIRETGGIPSYTDYYVLKGGSFDFELPFLRIQKRRSLSFVEENFGVKTSVSVGFRVVRE